MILTQHAAPSAPRLCPRFTKVKVGVGIWFAVCLGNLLTLLNIPYLRNADNLTFLLKDHFSSRKPAARYVTSPLHRMQLLRQTNKSFVQQIEAEFKLLCIFLQHV